MGSAMPVTSRRSTRRYTATCSGGLMTLASGSGLSILLATGHGSATEACIGCWSVRVST